MKEKKHINEIADGVNAIKYYSLFTGLPMLLATDSTTSLGNHFNSTLSQSRTGDDNSVEPPLNSLQDEAVSREVHLAHHGRRQPLGAALVPNEDACPRTMLAPRMTLASRCPADDACLALPSG